MYKRRSTLKGPDSATVAPSDGSTGEIAKRERDRPPLLRDIFHDAYHITFLIPTGIVAIPILLWNVYLCDHEITIVWRHDVIAALVASSGIWLCIGWTTLHLNAGFSLAKLFWLLVATFVGSIPYVGIFVVSRYAQVRVHFHCFWITGVATVLYWALVIRFRGGNLFSKEATKALALVTTTSMASIAFGSLYTGLPFVIEDPVVQLAVFGLAVPLFLAIYAKIGVVILAEWITAICHYEGEEKARFRDLFMVFGKLSLTIQSLITLYSIEGDIYSNGFRTFLLSVLSSFVFEFAPWLVLLMKLKYWAVGDEAKKMARIQDLEIKMVNNELAEEVAILIGSATAFVVNHPYSLGDLFIRVFFGVFIEFCCNLLKKMLAKREGVYVANVFITPTLPLFLGMSIVGQSCYFQAWVSMWLFNWDAWGEEWGEDWGSDGWGNETWGNDTWTNGTWTNGTWTNGTWTNGTWTNSTNSSWTNNTNP